MPKMNVNLTLTKDYRKNDCLAAPKTNPNKPNLRKAKMNLKSLAKKSGHTHSERIFAKIFESWYHSAMRTSFRPCYVSV
jgi:hypothetical protein